MIRGGICLNQTADVPVGWMVELAQEAEGLGFASCWAADQGLEARDVFVTLAAVAQRTRTLRLGTGIVNPYSRHPAVTAAAIATLDELSGGRAFLGLGAGGLDTLDPLGLDRARPLAALRETIQATRALWRGEPVTFRGERLRLEGARLAYGRPNLEIWLASRGPKILTLGGELADGVLLDFIHKETLQDYVDLVRAGAAAAGNRPRICYSTMIVTDERWLEQVRPVMTYRIVDFPPPVKARLGVTPAAVEAIRRTLAAEGLRAAGRLIPDDWIRPFVLMGSVAECAAELAGLAARFGFDEFLLPLLDARAAPDVLAATARVLAEVRAGAGNHTFTEVSR